MATPVTNFGLVTVSGVYDAAAVTVALQTGDGSRLPETTGGYTYPMTWWNATDYAHAALDPNKEIVLVTERSIDTLTVVRAQESTSSSAKNLDGKAYYMSLGMTKRLIESLRTPTQWFQGLQIQTHRDFDVAHKHVELVDVDSIIMDDGTELRNDNGEWSGKVADITVSGAGGLDSGVEESGYWYEIYAIAKEDGTRNLLLHKSILWAVETNSIAGEDATQGIRSAVDNSNVKVAQGFTFGESGPVPYVDVKLEKVGAPTGKIWLTIETDSAGKPSGTTVATSQAYDVSRLSQTPTTIRIPMKTSQVLSPAPTIYHLVAQGNWTISATNYVGWRMDGSAGAYTSGSKALFDSDTGLWTVDADDDMIFSVACQLGDPVVSLPFGYTEKCFLGWVWNNGAGNFEPFLQVERSHRVASITTDDRNISMSGSAQLIDFLSFVPPRAIIKVLIGIDGTGTGGGIAAIGDLRATDISYLGDTVGAQIVLYSAVTAAIPSTFGEVLMQHVGAMVHGTSGANLWVIGFSW